MRRHIDGWRPSPGLLVAVLALVAAVAGTAVAGPGATTSKLTKKKVVEIADQEINKLAPGLSVAHAGTANSAQNADLLDNLDSTDFLRGNASAGGDLTGSYPNPTIAADAVNSGKVSDGSLTGDDIANVTRSVNLPLPSFVDASNDAAIDFNSGADDAPDFLTFGAAPMLEFDVGPPPDRALVGTTFTVPPDAVPGAVSGDPGSLALRYTKGDETGNPDFLACLTSVNRGDTESDFGPLEAGIHTIVVPAQLTNPGDAVLLGCGVNTDDLVRILSVEFRYTATQ
jgi:hypothetical protein